MIKTPSLPESYYMSCFLSELSEELRFVIKTHAPQNLFKVFELDYTRIPLILVSRCKKE